MDALDWLRAERLRLKDQLANIESVLDALEYYRPEKRRGRHSMGDAERQEVSTRMKRYWASRRAEREARR